MDGTWNAEAQDLSLGERVEHLNRSFDLFFFYYYFIKTLGTHVREELTLKLRRVASGRAPFFDVSLALLRQELHQGKEAAYDATGGGPSSGNQLSRGNTFMV